MKIPKYVIDILQRSEYDFDLCRNHLNYAVGYTLSIKKYSHYQTAETFKSEVERFVSWCNKKYHNIACTLEVPNKTQHRQMQYAVVTVYDPMMKDIEKYIPNREKG